MLFVHPKGITNTFIQNSFNGPEMRNIRVDGANIQVYALTANQVADLDSFKTSEGLKYDVYEGNQDNGYRLRGSKKAHVNADSSKMIQALKAAKKKPKKNWRQISWHLKDAKGKIVSLATGDTMIYSKAEKTLCIFEGGGGLLTCNNAKGLVFGSEHDVFDFLAKLTALAGLDIDWLDHFDYIIFTVTSKARTRKQ